MMGKNKGKEIDLGIGSANFPVEVKCADTYISEFLESDEVAASELGVILSGSAAELMDRACAMLRDRARLSVQIGFVLLKAKHVCAHGDFGGFTESYGINRHRAAELMRLARFYGSRQEDERRSLFALGKSKALLLADADPKVVEVLLEDGDPGISTLSVRDMKARIKLLESDLEEVANSKDRAATNFQDEIDRRDSRIRHLEEARYQHPEFSPRTNLVRQSAAAMGEHVAAALDRLLNITAEVCDENGAEADKQLACLWWALAGCIAHITDRLEQFDGLTGGFRIDVSPSAVANRPELLMTAEEAREFILLQIAVRQRVIDKTRAQESDEPIQRKRGRPRKEK